MDWDFPRNVTDQGTVPTVYLSQNCADSQTVCDELLLSKEYMKIRTSPCLGIRWCLPKVAPAGPALCTCVVSQHQQEGSSYLPRTQRLVNPTTPSKSCLLLGFRVINDQQNRPSGIFFILDSSSFLFPYLLYLYLLLLKIPCSSHFSEPTTGSHADPIKKQQVYDNVAFFEERRKPNNGCEAHRVLKPKDQITAKAHRSAIAETLGGIHPSFNKTSFPCLFAQCLLRTLPPCFFPLLQLTIDTHYSTYGVSCTKVLAQCFPSLGFCR